MLLIFYGDDIADGIGVTDDIDVIGRARDVHDGDGQGQGKERGPLD